MKMKIPASPTNLIDVNKIPQHDLRLAEEVRQRSGVDINLCWHCRSCAGGCPFVRAMDYPPNHIIRFIQLGLKQEALKSSGIWICVGCNTFSIQCPNAIDIAAVNDTLRQMAMEQGVVVAEPNILHFHQAVLQSIERHGRTHKLEVMLSYKLKKHDWFADMAVGLKMFARRKLELLPSRNTNIVEIRRLFEHNTTIDY